MLSGFEFLVSYGLASRSIFCVAFLSMICLSVSFAFLSDAFSWLMQEEKETFDARVGRSELY